MSGGGIYGPTDYFWMWGPGEEREKAASNVDSFAYYTDAHTAKLVLSGQRVWMRGARHLNDTSEIAYGLELLRRLLDSSGADALKKSMNSLHSGSGSDLIEKLVKMGTSLLDDVFISCVSIHNSEENEIGRLSMWRAYGKSNGVAIVVKKSTLLDWSWLPVYALPTRYGEAAITETTLRDIGELAVAVDGSIYGLSRKELVDLVTASIQMQVIQCKHRAFSEEKEWRIIYLPNNQTFLDSIVWLNTERLATKEVEVGGVIQSIYELPIVPRLVFWDEGSEHKHRFGSLNDVIDLIMVGPAKDQNLVRDEFISILHQLRVDNPESKVVICDVPLRV